MSNEKIVGYVLYAVGIIGGAEGAVGKSITISVVALIVVVIASFMLAKD